jgi:nicotinamide-nucleotide amidase
MPIVLPSLLAAAVLAAPAPQEPEITNYRIVVTGGEILEGAYADAHTLFLTRTLHPLGLHCAGSAIVDDRAEDIKAALRFAADRVPLVIVTGGLGPTDNDITRETLSDFTGIPLKEDPDLLKEAQRRFGGELRANIRRQMQVPSRGQYLRNPSGSAAGLVFEQEKLVVVALPGPPRELQPIVQNELVPYLGRRFGTRKPGCCLTLRFVGLGQSQIDQTLKERAPVPPDVILFSSFEADRVDFTFALRGDTPQERARLEELKRKIAPHFKDNLYAEGAVTLEQVVIGLLKERGETLAVAEAGSGGALAAALSGTDGTGKVFSGAHVASTEEALRGMLGVADDRWAAADDKVKLLADAAAGSLKDAWAVAVGEVRPEGDRGPWVTAVFRAPDGRTTSQRLPARDRARLVTQLVDQLRRRLR